MEAGSTAFSSFTLLFTITYSSVAIVHLHIAIILQFLPYVELDYVTISSVAPVWSVVLYIISAFYLVKSHFCMSEKKDLCNYGAWNGGDLSVIAGHKACKEVTRSNLTHKSYAQPIWDFSPSHSDMFSPTAHFLFTHPKTDVKLCLFLMLHFSYWRVPWLLGPVSMTNGHFIYSIAVPLYQGMTKLSGAVRAKEV